MTMDAAIITLKEMNITQCGKDPWAGHKEGQEGSLSKPAPQVQLFWEPDVAGSHHGVESKKVEGGWDSLSIKNRTSG